jgi:quinoprotein glucose dehydrogenase
MNKPKFDSSKRLFLLLSIIVLTIYSGCKIYTKKNQINLDRTWSVYKADAEGTGYSILDEINKNTIQSLEIAWTHKFSDAPPGSRGGNSESNPIVVDGVMYTLSARHRVYALDAATGKQIWAFDPFNG